MPSNVTSLSGNGLRDWIVQRVSAVVLGAYFIFLLSFLCCHPDLDFDTWTELFINPWMRVFSVLALLNVLLHAWIGLWTICTDYLTCAVLRILAEVAIALSLIGLFLWGIEIVWGI